MHASKVGVSLSIALKHIPEACRDDVIIHIKRANSISVELWEGEGVPDITTVYAMIGLITTRKGLLERANERVMAYSRYSYTKWVSEFFESVKLHNEQIETLTKMAQAILLERLKPA